MLKRNLRFRITAIIVSMVLLLFVLNTIICAKFVRSHMEDLSDEKFVVAADYYAEIAEGWFSTNSTLLLNAADAAASQTDETIDTLQPFFTNIAETNDSVSEIYYASEKGKLLFAYYEAPEGFDATTRPWYTGAKETDGVYYSAPYTDQITGNLCITLSVAIPNGVVGMDLDLNNLTDSFPAVEEGYVMLATSDGSIILHPNEAFSLESGTISNINDVLGGSYAASMKDDDLFTDYNGTASYITASEVEVNGWIAAIVTPKSVYDKPIQAIINVFVALTLLFSAVAAVVVVFVSLNITKPLRLISDELNGIVDGIKAGEGDLSSRVAYHSEDELGQIADGVNNLMESLDELIPQSRNAAKNVSMHSETLVDISDQLTEAIHGITHAIGDVANGATQQASDVVSATQNVEQIGDAIDDVMTKTNELNDFAKDMQSASLSTEQQLSELKASTQTMVDAITHISEQIRNTSTFVDSINAKVATISEIAEETNLLSLNASIEAARAGEMGKGFAVVAEEIGKLAVNAAAAAESIRDEMAGLLASSQATVSESENVHELTVAQQSVLDETTEKLHTLLEEIDGTINHIVSIETEMSKCVSAKADIVTTMESLSAISEQNAASTEETSATTQLISTTIKDLSASSQDMHSIASELSDSLSIFK